MTLIQSARVAVERDRAEQEAAKAKAVNDFMQETLGSANPYEGMGRDVTVLEVLDAAVEKIDAAFGDQPKIAAAVKRTVGETYRRLGRYDEAEQLLRSALEMRKGVWGKKHLEYFKGFVWVRHTNSVRERSAYRR